MPNHMRLNKDFQPSKGINALTIIVWISALAAPLIAFGSQKGLESPIEFISMNEDYVVRMSTPQFNAIPTTRDGNTFIKLDVDGLGNGGEPGQAALPSYAFRLALGEDGTLPNISVRSARKTHHTFAHKIFPVQEYYPDSVPMSERPFTIYKDYYRSGGPKSDLISVSDPFTIRGVQGVIITIRPFT